MVVVVATVGCCDVTDDDTCNDDAMQTALDACLHVFDLISKSLPPLQLLSSGVTSPPVQW